jgi:hypothetical protein
MRFFRKLRYSLTLLQVKVRIVRGVKPGEGSRLNFSSSKSPLMLIVGPIPELTVRNEID